MPVVVALNAYLFWRARSPRLNWVVMGCADRVYVRLFVRRGRGRTEPNEPDILAIEASEIASMSIRTVDVFLYGPKPRTVEWLVIGPVQMVGDDISRHIRPLLAPDGKQVFVVNEEGRLTIEWKWCRPALREFLRQIARECPSIVIGPEDRSELDLNGIWHGISLNLDAQKRRLLVQAKRLGFGSNCRWLLCRYKYISLRKAAAYLAQIEREETGEESDCCSA